MELDILDREKARTIVDGIERLVSNNPFFSIPCKKICGCSYEFEFKLYGNDYDMARLNENIEKMDYVEYCEAIWNDEDGGYDFWGIVDVGCV